MPRKKYSPPGRGHPEAIGRRRALLRSLLLAGALAAMLLAWAGAGIYVARSQRRVALTPVVSSQPEPGASPGRGLPLWERAFLGAYLALRRGEVEAPAGAGGEPRPFSVQPGETAATIAPRLERMGLVKSAELFRLLARYEGADTKLEAGDYQLSSSMNMRQVLETLLHGREKGMRVTIPEGWRAEEVAELLTARGLLASAEEFLAAVRAGDIGQPLLQGRPAGGSASLEGYLFPDTYEFSPAEGARAIAERMVANFARRLPPDFPEKAARQGLTVHQAVVLAAIVEREAALAEEAPLIASVYLNRLRQGIRLDADPTVQYAQGRNPNRPGWWAPLKSEDLAFDSPYNTYRNLGLPPGPICSPGLTALRAVVEPADTPYFYFVRNDLQGDRSHVFARTYQEHLANIAGYQKR